MLHEARWGPSGLYVSEPTVPPHHPTVWGIRPLENSRHSRVSRASTVEMWWRLATSLRSGG